MKIFLALAVSFFIFSVFSFILKQTLDFSNEMSELEKKCFTRCDAVSKHAIIFGQDQCACMTPIEFEKKYYPTKYKKRRNYAR
jgi:hypothetical protein